MFRQTDDLRITQVRPLIPPAILLEEIPLSERASNVVSNARLAVARALEGRDPRLVVVAGRVRSMTPGRRSIMRSG
jgi:3-deoxy-7-phosphoheptulonate synthase